MKDIKRTALILLVLLVMGVFAGASVRAAANEPFNVLIPLVWGGAISTPYTEPKPIVTEVSGNLACSDLGYDFGFKVEGAPNGTFYFTNEDGELTGGAPEDLNNYVVISNSDGYAFDWMASLGIDAVIVKGGPVANTYEYNPEADNGSGLTAPVNPKNNKLYGISHIEFCYDYELDISKDATTLFTRTWKWTIEKTVAPEVWELFTGDSGTSMYEVKVDKNGFEDNDWEVTGTILIENNTPLDATITSVRDRIVDFREIDVNCGVTFPYVLPAGDNLICSYGTDLPDGTDRWNKAQVTTAGVVGGGIAEAEIDFDDPTTEYYAEVNVTDTNGMAWGPVTGGMTWTYEKTFTCDADAGKHENVATIVETGQSDAAEVMVSCYVLDVTKDVETSFNRIYDWTIQKWGDQTELMLAVGAQATVNYEVTVDATYSDEGFAVSGMIYVHNPAPMNAILTNVSDVVSPDIVADVDCGVAFPYELPAGETLTCSYSADNLSDGTDRTNVATATLQNYDYELVSTPSGTTDFVSAPYDVIFADMPTDEIDECIDVTDDQYGFLGTVCANDVLPKIFDYSLVIGPYEAPEACGAQTFTNIAFLVTNDTGTYKEDAWTVEIEVICACTLPPGYWKTHPEDPTWNLLLQGTETIFFLSGQTYYQVLWNESEGGNAYYILAHAYIAAELNALNGTDLSEVQATFDRATELLEMYTPDEIGQLSGGDALREEFIDLSEILDNYNNGIIGPGHCPD